MALGQLAGAAVEAERASAAKNTVVSYASDWDSWRGLCATHNLTQLRADPEQARL